MRKKFKIKNKKLKTHTKNVKIFEFLICVFYFWFFIFNFPCFAQSISSTELINNAKLYDGKTVVYEGEAIGDVMARGDYCWVNINDGENAIGVWLNNALAVGIAYTGSFKSKGDKLEITGIFNRSCPQHGGDLDIHGLALRKISSGRVLVEQLNTGKRNQVFILMGFLCLVLILRRLKKK